MELFARAVEACPWLALVDATRTHAEAWRLGDSEPPGIRELAAYWREFHRASSVLVVIDSLHVWAAASPRAVGATEYEYLNAAVAELQHLAADLAAPVLVVAERNRAAMGNDGQSSAKGSARIEYSAESILSLNRELDSNGEWKHDGAFEYPLTARLVKNRAGRTGPTVAMRFNGALAALHEA